MRMCDRHPRTQARDTVKLGNDDQIFDVCDECVMQILEFIGNPAKDSVESKPKRKILRGLRGK